MRPRPGQTALIFVLYRTEAYYTTIGGARPIARFPLCGFRVLHDVDGPHEAYFLTGVGAALTR